ncbi:MAG: hypothetical protein FJ399_17075 [Verrucomicrobia bacterium]|nr:hypothetical protein [Verrucomicrobiota bacterium]
MNLGSTVFSQVLAGLDATEVARAAALYPMPRASRALSAYDHSARGYLSPDRTRDGIRQAEGVMPKHLISLKNPSSPLHMGASLQSHPQYVGVPDGFFSRINICGERVSRVAGVGRCRLR